VGLRDLLLEPSAPEVVWPMTRSVLRVFIGREQVTTTLPDRSPACFSTSCMRDQCTASKTASASGAASRGVPWVALPLALRASVLSFCSLRA
jgi:hypothetical protein